MNRFLLAVSTLIATASVAQAFQGTNKTMTLPGQRPDGSVLLPNQWSLRPVGAQVPLGDLPVNIAVHPEGRYAAVLHSGHGPHEIIVVDLKLAKVVSRVPIRESFYGLEFSKGGARLFCSGAGDEVIHMFDFRNGELTANGEIKICDPKERGVPCGMAVGGNARDLFVANVWGQCVSKVDILARTNMFDITPLPGHERTTMRNSAIEPADPVDDDTQAITKRAQAVHDPTKADAPFPYACRLDEKRQLLYVSLWARAQVAVIDLKSNRVKALWQTQEHPNEMILSRNGHHLFVANANRNTITVINTEYGKVLETLFASFSPSQPPGSTPMSLALSPDENFLFVANACNNNVAVFDVSTLGRSKSLGFIPTGWYPTSVRVTPDGKYLVVANGKGLISKANPNGPVPGKKRTPESQFIDELFPGTLSIIELPKRESEFKKQLAAWTAQAFLCTPQASVPQVHPAPGNPVPSEPGKVSPIKHVIYIIKENRTYDQVLGDMKEGNGDAKLCLFPEKVTPNLHRLAREFVLLDNFYVDAEVSADGHEWSMGAWATDFVEKTWPMNYRKAKKFPYPSEGHFPIASPSDGYLWDQARKEGLSYRSYGEFVFNGRTPKDPAWTRTESLKGHFDPMYHGFDTGYPDVKRAERFIEELKRMVAENEMPNLIILRLPNDHTSGTSLNKPTPVAAVADNDRALGMIVEAVSRSKFWPQTAIFVLEDDAQNGPDHVDAHRSPAFVISPYTRRGIVDSTMYSTTSMLRTMELILGLKPMTQFDAAATPMYNCFDMWAVLKPYTAAEPGVDLNERNLAMNKDTETSRKMDFSKEDAADDQQLNEVIWRSVRGQDSVMPAPVRAAFVMAQPKKDNDD